MKEAGSDFKEYRCAQDVYKANLKRLVYQDWNLEFLSKEPTVRSEGNSGFPVQVCAGGAGRL